MKWHKVEFELGASKSYGGERLLDYWSKKEITILVRVQLRWSYKFFIPIL